MTTGEILEPPDGHGSSGDPARHCSVRRIDDHGNTFVVREHLTRSEAEQVAAEFTARGHKQMYWVEPEPVKPRQ